MSYAAGFDIGTTLSAAAVASGSRIEIVTLGSNANSIPTVAYLREDQTVVVGETAEQRGASDPSRLAREFKRRVGDPTPVVLGGTPLPAHLLLSRVLAEVLRIVTEREGSAPDAIAVTHPANWGPFKLDFLRQAIVSAGCPAAYTLISEPEAAAVHYAAIARVEPGALVAVYDLGGGTFDVAILRKTETGYEFVGTPQGEEHLGGVDIDDAIVRWVLGQLALDRRGIEDDAATMVAFGHLRQQCIRAKIALSTDTETAIPVLLPGRTEQVRMTRGELEDLIRPILAVTVAAVSRTLTSARLDPAAIDRVLLIGGSSRIPLVSEMLAAELGRPVAVDIDPKSPVALGAARVALTALGTAGAPTAPAAPIAPAAPPTAAAPTPPVVPVAAAGAIAAAATRAPPAPPAPPAPDPDGPPTQPQRLADTTEAEILVAPMPEPVAAAPPPAPVAPPEPASWQFQPPGTTPPAPPPPAPPPPAPPGGPGGAPPPPYPPPAPARSTKRWVPIAAGLAVALVAVAAAIAFVVTRGSGGSGDLRAGDTTAVPGTATTSRPTTSTSTTTTAPPVSIPWAGPGEPSETDRALLAQVPVMFEPADSCRPISEQTPDPFGIYPGSGEGVLGSIECTYGSDGKIVFSLFPDDSFLQPHLDRRLVGAGRNLQHGQGQIGPTPPWQHDYRDDPLRASGSIFGFQRTGRGARSEVGWVQTGTRTYAYSYRMGTDYPSYYRWWAGVFKGPAPPG